MSRPTGRSWHIWPRRKATLEVESLDVVADGGYFSSEDILACEKTGITVSLPKPMTSNSKAKGVSYTHQRVL